MPGFLEPTEVTAAAGTAAAIALVPEGMVLVDFVADAEVCLIFGPPAARAGLSGDPAGRGGGPCPSWDDRWDSAA